MIRVADPSLDHVIGCLQVVHARVAAAVAERRRHDPNPDDPFRGLYVSEEDADRLLASGTPPARAAASPEADRLRAEVETAADGAERSGADLRLRRLARSFGLDHLDMDVLLVSLAPDVEPAFERLYAYLQDDVSRRRASIGLALDLAGASPAARGTWARLGEAGPLVAGGLILVEGADQPFLSRTLRVPDRITAHLLGDDSPDPTVHRLAVPWVDVEIGDAETLARAVGTGGRLCYVRGRPGSAARSLAATALIRAGFSPLVIDLERLEAGDDLTQVASIVHREAALSGGGVVAGPVDAIADRGGAIRAFAEAACPVVLIGVRGWDPGWSAETPVMVEAPVATGEQRAALWRRALDGDHPITFDPSALTRQFSLSPEQVARAAGAARRDAAAAGRHPGPSDVLRGARSQNAAGLERLARRIEPTVSWGDLVLPSDRLAQLRELSARVRHREQVLDEWGFGARSSRGRGITALFAGDSGTGKTMSAEVIAGDVGLDLYVIDLSTVVDKYVGETEKNLDRIFAEAERVNGVLLFDEADALFGKRSEVKDARDRWANVEVAYLLQRMELFDGMAILTTNLRANLDEAFTRRLDVVVDFPMPEVRDRRVMWEHQLRKEAPRAPDVDLDFLARSFRLSGGNIRNIAVGAGYLAAMDELPIGMGQLIVATGREYRKLGRLCVESEFGPYHPLLGGPSGDAVG